VMADYYDQVGSADYVQNQNYSKVTAQAISEKTQKNIEWIEAELKPKDGWTARSGMGEEKRVTWAPKETEAKKPATKTLKQPESILLTQVKKQKAVCVACSGDHVFGLQCSLMPKVPVDTWKRMSTAERKQYKLDALARVKNQTVQLQAVSAHTPYSLDLIHDNLPKIYLPGCNPSCKDKDLFGCMVKANVDSNSYVFITEHQHTKDTYYLNSEGLQKALPDRREWKEVNNGLEKVLYIPTGKLNLPKSRAVAIQKPTSGAKNSCMYAGYSPVTGEKVIATTDYSWTSSNTLKHSASTQNFSCGAVLVQQNNGTCSIVGIHYGTNGPNPQGGNNLMAVLPSSLKEQGSLKPKA